MFTKKIKGWQSSISFFLKPRHNKNLSASRSNSYCLKGFAEEVLRRPSNSIHIYQYNIYVSTCYPYHVRQYARITKTESDDLFRVSLFDSHFFFLTQKLDMPKRQLTSQLPPRTNFAVLLAQWGSCLKRHRSYPICRPPTSRR